MDWPSRYISFCSLLLVFSTLLLGRLGSTRTTSWRGFSDPTGREPWLPFFLISRHFPTWSKFVSRLTTSKMQFLLLSNSLGNKLDMLPNALPPFLLCSISNWRTFPAQKSSLLLHIEPFQLLWISLKPNKQVTNLLLSSFFLSILKPLHYLLLS